MLNVGMRSDTLPTTHVHRPWTFHNNIYLISKLLILRKGYLGELLQRATSTAFLSRFQYRRLRPSFICHLKHCLVPKLS